MAVVNLDLEKDVLVVNFPQEVNNDGRSTTLETVFPFPWLRDNCQCEDCCHWFTRERIFLFRNLDADAQPSQCQIENEVVKLTWPDGHDSPYPLQWLYQHRFEQDNRDCYHTSVDLDERLWTAADMQNHIKRYDFNQFMNDDQVFLKWLMTMEQDGLSLLTGAPLHEGIVKQIGVRVAMPKTTHYGETFKVVTKAKPSNVAYTPKPLGLHGDLPPLSYSPGVQMLHCIKQVESKGGENIFSDAFRVVYDMKKENERLYKILCETPIDFDDKGEDLIRFHMQCRKPTVECDITGKVIRVNYNNQLRGAMLSVPIEKVKPLYQAMALFEKMLNDPKYCIRYKMNNGEVVIFHNFRVLHGRDGYAADGARHLEGAYIDWDYMKSRRRVLQAQLSSK